MTTYQGHIKLKLRHSFPHLTLASEATPIVPQRRAMQTALVGRGTHLKEFSGSKRELVLITLLHLRQKVVLTRLTHSGC